MMLVKNDMDTDGCMNMGCCFDEAMFCGPRGTEGLGSEGECVMLCTHDIVVDEVDRASHQSRPG